GGYDPNIMPYAASYEQGPATLSPSQRLVTPELTAMEKGYVNPAGTAPQKSWYESMLDNTIKSATNNPFSALALLGSGGAAIAGLSQSGAGKVTVPKRTTELS